MMKAIPDANAGEKQMSRIPIASSTIFQEAAFAVCLVTLVGCDKFPGDKPLYETPLPNGYAQSSNGGELGRIVRPFSATSAKIIAPLGPGPLGKRQWANDFGWAGDIVIAQVIEYADRAFVDPPISRRYLLLDTRSGKVDYYNSMRDLTAAWEANTTEPMPDMERFHSTTIEKDLGP